MIIGVPKEIKDYEYRVSLTPDGARVLLQAGHRDFLTTRIDRPAFRWPAPKPRCFSRRT